MNTPADIHCYTWFQSTKTKKFWLVVHAYWAHDEEADRWLPSGIELLEHLTCKPLAISCAELCAKIESGDMKVVASPI